MPFTFGHAQIFYLTPADEKTFCPICKEGDRLKDDGETITCKKCGLRVHKTRPTKREPDVCNVTVGVGIGQ
jgi:tRNA(Ile2) C34 agmatinyltransferase TiaS